MIPWEATRKSPVVALRMIATRQFGSCFFVMLAIGAILISTTQMLPQLLQLNFGYTAMLAARRLRIDARSLQERLRPRVAIVSR